MRVPKAIVFDLDGTLLETRLDIAAAGNHTLSALGISTREVSEISRFVGDGARSLVARLVGRASDDPFVDEALAIFSAYYVAHPADHATLIAGAREALDACAPLPLCLATNKPRNVTLPLLDALKLTARFAVVVAGGDGPLKPDPAAVVAAVSPLGIAAADAWVVGDGPQDIGAGKAAGAVTVGVLGGFADEARLRAAGPDLVLGSLHELAPAIARASTAAQGSPKGR